MKTLPCRDVAYRYIIDDNPHLEKQINELGYAVIRAEFDDYPVVRMQFDDWNPQIIVVPSEEMWDKYKDTPKLINNFQTLDQWIDTQKKLKFLETL